MKKLKIFLLAALMIFGLSVFASAAPYGVVTATGTAASVYTATSATTTIGVLIQNSPASTVNVYVGSDSSVTTSSYGYILIPGAGIILDGHQNSWWVITAGTSATVSFQLLF